MFDFPASPTTGQVYQGWSYDGEKWVATSSVPTGFVRYDAAQGLTVNQQAQARQNTGMTKKNYAINGGMQISQENGATVLTTSGVYPVDMFAFNSTFTGTWTVAQVASLTPGGSPNRIQAKVTAVDAAMTGAKYAILFVGVEGLRMADLKAGTAAAKQITVQFGVKAPAGTYCVSVQNGPASNRSYIAEYTIAAGEANTDVVKSVTLTLNDTVGTWVNNNTAGMFVNFCLGVGPTGQGVANSWLAGGFLGTANQYNWFSVNGNTFELFDVGVYEGSVAPPFMVPDYASELALCKRYWQKIGTPIFSSYNGAGALTYGSWTSPVEFRAAPTSAFSNVGYSNGSGLVINLTTTTIFSVRYVTTAAGAAYVTFDISLNARL